MVLNVWDKRKDESLKAYEHVRYYMEYLYTRTMDDATDKEIAGMRIDTSKSRSYKVVAAHFGVSTSIIEAQGKNTSGKTEQRHMTLIFARDLHRKTQTKLLV